MIPGLTNRFTAGCFGSAVVLGAVVVSGSAAAATVALNDTGQMKYSLQYIGPNSTTPTVQNEYSLAVPGQYTFTEAFTVQQNDAVNHLGTSSVGPYDFQDSYRFTIAAGASGNTLVASLGLPPTFNIANIQFRLYMVASASTQPIVGGIPPGSTLITAWMGPPAGQSSVSASFSGIQSGTYMLDIAGIANGTNGGTYTGQLNLQPVPLPAAFPLRLSGLGLVAGIARRRRARLAN